MPVAARSAARANARRSFAVSHASSGIPNIAASCLRLSRSGRARFSRSGRSHFQTVDRLRPRRRASSLLLIPRSLQARRSIAYGSGVAMNMDCAHKHDSDQEQSVRAKRLRMEPADIIATMATVKVKRGKSVSAAQSDFVREFLTQAGCVDRKYSEFARRLHYDPSALSRFMRGGGASADMIDAIHRYMRVNLWDRIKQGRAVDTPNLTAAIKVAGLSVSPEAVARVRFQEHPDDSGDDPSVEWWTQRLMLEQAIVRLIVERERGGRVKK